MQSNGSTSSKIQPWCSDKIGRNDCWAKEQLKGSALRTTWAFSAINETAADELKGVQSGLQCASCLQLSQRRTQKNRPRGFVWFAVFDNVKYLTTLEKFIEPLYSGTPAQIIETLPALLNSVTMIHTIARYYNTSERITNLFSKITNQMIHNCRTCIIGDCEDASQLWEISPPELIKNLEVCLKLNVAPDAQNPGALQLS
ncbi:unnamed protein product [Cladocopium goreaui]|uniref:Dynein gamma chain, flagellar outer arm n=1 Tax=Cladocopium goreaui TaxID=2562237 RepID=A0A9P1DCK1_9DINO|nr:unnamed protein product [Cladocopium goreaui]